jgi:transcriptional regulator with XRE-family HTH domain
MTTKKDKPLKDRLKEEMKRRGVKMPQLEKETGIPKDRMYKWFQSDNVPKYEDAIILENWMQSGTIPDSGILKPALVPPLESEKLDLLLIAMQQHSQQLQSVNRKLNELEQQNIVNAAIQTQFQEYLVSRLDKDSDPEMTVVEQQRKAFEKLTRIQTADKGQNSHSLHR